MAVHLFKVIFQRDDVTGSGMNSGEMAAYDLPTAARLIATGTCRIADDDPELEAAVKAYRKPWSNPDWLMPAVSRRGRILLGMFGRAK